MHHVWAHVVKFKPQVYEENTNLNIANVEIEREVVKDDITRLYTCPECLKVLSSLHHMHLHYHRVHRHGKLLGEDNAAVCYTCEAVVEDLHVHANVHGQHDLPYNCRKCKYR